MTLLKKLQHNWLFLAGFLGIMVVSVFSLHLFVQASQYPGSLACNTSTATTTFSFLTRGTGTTTLRCVTRSIDALSVNVILAASSTDTRYLFRIERSMNDIDWYADVGFTNELATTTRYTSNFLEYSLRFASTTNGIPGGSSQDVAFSGTGTTSASLINFTVPTLRSDYTRVVFYLDNDTKSAYATTTNGAIRAEGIVKETVTR